jgi:hypothetical protein
MQRRAIQSFLLFAAGGFGPAVLGYLLFLVFWLGVSPWLWDAVVWGLGLLAVLVLVHLTIPPFAVILLSVPVRLPAMEYGR